MRSQQPTSGDRLFVFAVWVRWPALLIEADTHVPTASFYAITAIEKDSSDTDGVSTLTTVHPPDPLFNGEAPFALWSDSQHMRLVVDGTREELIAWLCWNDPNGTYTDRDSVAEGMRAITLEEARRIMCDQIARA